MPPSSHASYDRGRDHAHPRHTPWSGRECIMKSKHMADASIRPSARRHGILSLDIVRPPALLPSLARTSTAARRGVASHAQARLGRKWHSKVE
nr:hypothetical protein CFP56_16655 [Quercus suber]